MAVGNILKSSAEISNEKTFQYKLVLLGESAVGKSSLVLRFVKNIFSTSQESTIGAAFLTQTLHVDGDTMKFEIWDTAGQERYHSLAPMYYRGANAAVIVYDITSIESFERAKKWVSELDKQAQPDIVIALVGNKTDLQTKRQVQKEDVATYAQQTRPDLILMEASAKSGDNVNELFDAIAQKLPKTDVHLATMNRAFTASGSRKIDLSGNSESNTKSSCC